MNDLKKWIQIRKDLYRQVESQVQHRLGQDTPELMRYSKVYNQEFTRKWSVATKDALWDQLSQSQVVLVGDFHALHQSQKAQVRILRHIPKDRKAILAVEFFEAEDQDKIDKYMAGRMSEKDFLKAIDWKSKWGFPWEHYRPLLRWAQKHNVAVYGLNRSYKKRSAATLKSRDVFAGKRIAELVRSFPDQLVVVIYGDLHLAGSHIPAEIVKNLGDSFAKRILRIFQNSEKIYFQLLQRELEASTEVVRLARNIFCLMSVPPWVKWQNYLMYLERTYDQGLAEQDEDWDSGLGHLDYTDHVGRYVNIISEELGVPVSTSGLSVYTAEDSSFWTQVHEHFSGRQLLWIERLISEESSFYLPEAGVAYLARGTVNHAASLAMHFVHAQLCKQKNFQMNLPDDFLRMIWKEAVVYFGSKIINHKRKTDTIADIKMALTVRGASDLGKEALQLALSQKMHELMIITGVSEHKMQLRPRKKGSYLLAAELLGGMMGERLFFGYRKKLITKNAILSFLRKSIESSNFDVIYYEILEVVESLPAPFHSKRERL